MKHALVTGGGRGLGKAFCEVLVRQGFTVFKGMRDSSSTPELIQSIVPITLDVGLNSSIEDAFENISKYTNSLDIIINNAGINKDTGTEGKKELVTNIEKLDRSMMLKLYNINALGAMFVTKNAVPFLKNDPSWIINISSNRASFHDKLEDNSGNYGYRASKIALNMLTFSSVNELPSNIRTFAVHPGDMQTRMNPDGKDDPLTQAESILAITKNWNMDMNGKFLQYDGTFYPL